MCLLSRFETIEEDDDDNGTALDGDDDGVVKLFSLISIEYRSIMCSITAVLVLPK